MLMNITILQRLNDWRGKIKSHVVNISGKTGGERNHSKIALNIKKTFWKNAKLFLA
jgi:hypothetical protein